MGPDTLLQEPRRDKGTLILNHIISIAYLLCYNYYNVCLFIRKKRICISHWEVLAVEFELLPHAHKQAQVEMVQQQMNGHVPLPACLQKVTQQLHIAEAVHDNNQGLHMGHIVYTQAMFDLVSHVHVCDMYACHIATVPLLPCA